MTCQEPAFPCPHSPLQHSKKWFPSLGTLESRADPRRWDVSQALKAWESLKPVPFFTLITLSNPSTQGRNGFFVSGRLSSLRVNC